MENKGQSILKVVVISIFGLTFLMLVAAACQPAPSGEVAPASAFTPTAPSINDNAPMAFVPAGPFLMGSTILANEQPEHTVALGEFWVDVYEVTNAHYKACVDAGACRPPASNASNIYATYYGDPAYDNFPVNQVSWDDAVAYCGWAGKRLPTEAEWEKAARGTDGRRFPWGNQWDAALAQSNLSLLQDAVAVGSFPGGASPYGALDMAGNVWEWVRDWYSTDYYASSPAENPAGPETGEAKVVRGGGYGVYDAGMRTTVRRGDVIAQERYTFVGFRCVY